MGVGNGFARLSLGVGEQRQRPFRRDARIELAQTAGGSIARVGEHLLARSGLLLVHLEEVGLGHEDLTADLDQRRRMTLQPRRHGLHRAEIGGDVLALGAVAARRTADEAAALIGQIDRQSIDLRFRDECQRRIRGQPDKAARAGAELGEFLGVHRVVQRQHRHAVAHLGETGLRRPSDAVGRRVVANEMWEACLDCRVASAQRVIVCVADLRRILLVVQPVVMRDLPRQMFEFGCRVRFGEVLDGRYGYRRGGLAWGAGHGAHQPDFDPSPAEGPGEGLRSWRRPLPPAPSRKGRGR